MLSYLYVLTPCFGKKSYKKKKKKKLFAGEIAGEENLKMAQDNNGKLEDELTVAKLYISKMKSEEKNLVQRCQGLESYQADCNKKVSEYEKDLGECRLLISQHEAKVQSLQESIKEAELRKRTLEEDVDALREECAKWKAAEQVQAVSNKEKTEEKEAYKKMSVVLEEQMDQLRDVHKKQVATLRDEISEKQQLISELKDQNQKFTLAHQQMQKDNELLKQEETEKSVKLQDDGSLAQKQMISFLKDDLDLLTKVKKQLERGNAHLRCELPKLENSLRARMERVEALETALRDAKEGAMRDPKRYQYEVDRIREAIRQKNLALRGHNVLTAKPIQEGQHHVTGVNAKREIESEEF